MTRWVALLRGVNVGGVTIRSADLAALVTGLGFTGVRTVLASGNVVLDGADEESREAVKARLEAGLRERFGYEAWVVVLAAPELERVAAGFPFDAADDARTPYVVFSSDAGVLADLADRAEQAAADGPDLLARGDGVLYWHPPRGSSTETAFARLSAAAHYKPHLTTRNLRTVEKVLALTRR